MQPSSNMPSSPHRSIKPLTPSSTDMPSSTNKVILDYLLYLSIQSRLRQAAFELSELDFPEHDNDAHRQRQWFDTAYKAEQDKKAVESIVAGILSSHQNRKPSFPVDSPLKQRLHLCQLTNYVFGRFDRPSHDYDAHSTRRIRRHNSHNSALFAKPILPSFCRRHRRQSCSMCRDTSTSSSVTTPPPSPRSSSSLPSTPPPPGLIDAIPVFLKTSADLLRRTLEAHKDGQEVKPMVFAGQKVMGGGMPPRWYDLFLELLTQAAIETYLCDAQTGPEPIFEIFSYGYVEDEDEPNDDDDEDEDDDEEDEEEEEAWNVRAADHHLLFPKTRTMYLFKTQVREREKEFLVVDEEKDNLQQHFQKLAQRYPLKEFEKSMSEFIQMVLQTMDVPVLDQCDDEAPSSIYRYPGDGSLLMPEIPDNDDEPLLDQSSAQVDAIASSPMGRHSKRRLSDDEDDEPQSKRHRAD